MLDGAARKVAGMLLVGLLAVAGCGSDDGAGVRNLDGEQGSASGSGSGSGTGSGTPSGSGTGSAAAASCEPDQAGSRVDVTLDEWSVAPKRTSAKAGAIGFRARNVGAKEHELLIVRAASPSSLPTAPDGSVAEDRLDPGSRIGEVGEVGPGKACSGRFTLSKGSYVLICNIVGKAANGATEAHYAQGMVNLFSVS